MSLLLDALKRAEQEKLARGERPDLQIVSPADAVAANSAAHAAPRGVAPPQQPPSRGSLELQPLGQQPPGAAPKAGSPAAAQAVFQAKLPAGGGRDKPRRGWLYAAAAAIALAVIVAGAYVWYAMQALAPTPVPARRMAGPLAPPPFTPMPPGTVIPAAPDRNAATLTVPVVTPSPKTTDAAKAAPALPSREQTAADLLRQAPARREPALRLDREAPVRLDRAPPTQSIPAEVATGYQALRNSDLAAARRAYTAAVAADPANADAILGMATVEARTGNLGAAGAAYRRALELEPRNATALAGLATLSDPSRHGNVEARLREDLMRYPQSAPLHFALGNVFSAQARWSEAQAEYFEAHRLDPASADIAHNLAVALDNLGQGRLAAQFYRRALEAARTQPAQFDPAPAARRLAELGS